MWWPYTRATIEAVFDHRLWTNRVYMLPMLLHLLSPEDAVQTLLAQWVMPSVQMLTYSQQVSVINCQFTVVLTESQAVAWKSVLLTTHLSLSSLEIRSLTFHLDSWFKKC